VVVLNALTIQSVGNCVQDLIFGGIILFSDQYAGVRRIAVITASAWH
jgi:hypothetical protein